MGLSFSTHVQEAQITDKRNRIDGVSMVRKIRDLAFSLGLFFLLLLILSGEIELNLGPETGNLKTKLSDAIQCHKSKFPQ